MDPTTSPPAEPSIPESSTVPPCPDPSHATAVEERDRYEQGWKRALADYQNLKRETERAQKEFAQWCTSELLLELLAPADHFDEALAHIPEGTSGGWVEGFTHIRRELEEIFKRHGVEGFAVAGEVFDPTIHEAVEHQFDQGQPEQTIAKVVAKGYRLSGKLLRPAKVIVYTISVNKES